MAAGGGSIEHSFVAHPFLVRPALRLYERLGFLPIADKGVYHLMERAPG